MEAWEVFKLEAVKRLPSAARGWLGGPGGSHPCDFDGADGAAFRKLGDAALLRAAGNAATALGDVLPGPGGGRCTT